jgi:hypothetical protein
MSELQIRKDITKCDGIMLVTILTPVWRHWQNYKNFCHINQSQLRFEPCPPFKKKKC